MTLYYKEALEQLRYLAKQTDWYAEFNILALALQENLEKEILFGTTELSREGRYKLIYRLDQLTKAHQLDITFSDLCRDPTLVVHEQTNDVITTNLQEKQKVRRVQPQRLGTHEKWAVLVGINEYEHAHVYGHLQFCAQDATNIFKTLSNNGFAVEHMHLLTDRNTPQKPLREHILTTLEITANATEPDDLLLFYFSGHGRAEGGESYLIPRNGTATLRHTGIPLRSIKEIMIGARSKAKVIILDACHSGANIQTKGKLFMSEEFLNDVFKNAEGLAIISSCQQDQLSYEWPEKQCGVFTYYLLEALQGKADYEEKGFITISDINRYLTHNVKQWAVQHQLSQIPRLHYTVTGEIVLLECQRPKGATLLQAQNESGQTGAEQSTDILNQYIGNLDALRKGRVHQEIAESLAQETIQWHEKQGSSSEDILERYHAIPLHALLLYTSEDQAMATYLTQYLAELDELTDNVCDVYPIVDQFKHPRDANAYTFMRELDVLHDAHFDAYEQLPVLFFWDGHGANEYISFGNNANDLASIKGMLRQIFGTLRREPTITHITQIKERLQQTDKSIVSMYSQKQKGSHRVDFPDASDQRNTLYQIMQQYTSDLDLQEICVAVNVHYNRLRGNSHAEKAFSLVTDLYNQDRLADLEQELRNRLPRRFL